MHGLRLVVVVHVYFTKIKIYWRRCSLSVTLRAAAVLIWTRGCYASMLRDRPETLKFGGVDFNLGLLLIL